jgi:pyruvate/2-oxoglutarate/acetoin dehydrogenase E1 component
MATVEVEKKTLSTMVQAVRSALIDEMTRDEDVVLLGEDIGKRGGVFLVTEGLIDKFGKERVIDTPLAEAGIIGAAVGMSVYGLKAVAEIQFIDFLYPGFDQLVSEAAKMRYRSAGQFSCPMVVRSPYGGGVRGGSYHSQSPEAYYVATPGLKVVVPSNPYDAKGLLIASIRDPDPVVFMEPKKIYRAEKREVPEGAYEVPLGKANVVRQGKHVTLVAYGAMIPLALDAAEQLKADGVEAEVLDFLPPSPRRATWCWCKRRRASAATWARSLHSSPKRPSAISKDRSCAPRVGIRRSPMRSKKRTCPMSSASSAP